MHLSDLQLDMLSHEELAPREAAAALEHLAQCGDCASRRERHIRDERSIGDALRLLDYPAPKARADTIIAQVKRHRRTPYWRLAAGIALLATAGVAAAMPGSPIRAWIDRTRALPPGVQQPKDASPELAREPTPAPAGISIAASDTVDLLFEAEQAGGSIRISFGTGSDLQVRAVSGRAGFAVRSGGLWVRNRGSVASYEVTVPSSATSVKIRVADRTVFRKQGALIGPAPQRERDGSYLVRLGADKGSRSREQRTASREQYFHSVRQETTQQPAVP